MRQELKVIAAFLERVRAKMLQQRLREAAIHAGVCALIWSLLLLTLGALGWVSGSRLSAALAWGALLGGVGAVFGQLWLRDRLGLRDLARVARRAEANNPSLRDDLSTALEFGARLEREGRDALDVNTSAELVEAQLRKTARDTERYRARVRLFVAPRDTRRAQRALVGLGVATLTFALITPGALDGAFGLALGRAADAHVGADAEAARGEQARALLVGNLIVEMTPPAYTRQRSRTLNNTSGHLRDVLRGTRVAVEGYARLPSVERGEGRPPQTPELTRATLIYETEAGATTEVPLEVDGRRVAGVFTARDPGSYRFRLSVSYDGETRVLDHDLPREVGVREDLAPTVTIESPRGPLDVGAEDVVELGLMASDEYGLTEVALLIRFQGDEATETRRVVAQVEGQSSYAGRHALDLAELGVQPKDVISVVAEAVDNDTVSRPKPGYSEALILRVTSLEDRHEALLEAEEALFEALLLLLADHLERPVLRDEPGQLDADGEPDEPVDQPPERVVVDAQALANSRQEVLDQLAAHVERMRADPLMLRRDHDLLRGLHATLYELHRDEARLLERVASALRLSEPVERPLVALGRQRVAEVAQMERALILLEELIASQWLDAMQMTVDSIRETKERLRAMLEEYREAQDPELKREILKEVQRLQQRMDELMSRLSRQSQRLPQEFLNAEAFRQQASETAQQMNASAEDIRQMIEQGDIDAALDALEQMDQRLDEMIGMIDQGVAPNSGGDSLSRMDQQANELMDAVNDLAAAESALERDTATLRDDLRRQRTDALQETLDDFVAQQQQRLDAMRQDIDRIRQRPLASSDQAALAEVEQTLDSLDRQLGLKNIDGARATLDRLTDNLREAGFTMNASRFDAPPGAGADHDASLRDIEHANQVARQLQRDLDALLERARPQPDAAALDQMSQLAQRQMQLRQQADDLQQTLDAASAEFPAFSEQLQGPLDDARRFMDDATGQLGGGELMPSLESERQALRSIHSMKRQLQQTVQRQRMEQQGQQQDSERVEIPEQSRDAPRAFRQDLLDAMKQQGLPGFEDENQRYYRSLVE